MCSMTTWFHELFYCFLKILNWNFSKFVFTFVCGRSRAKDKARIRFNLNVPFSHGFRALGNEHMKSIWYPWLERDLLDGSSSWWSLSSKGLCIRLILSSKICKFPPSPSWYLLLVLFWLFLAHPIFSRFFSIAYAYHLHHFATSIRITFVLCEFQFAAVKWMVGI